MNTCPLCAHPEHDDECPEITGRRPSEHKPCACKQHLIAARRQRIVALTRQGLPAHEIADRMGISTRTVHRDRVAAGIGQVQPPKVPLSADEITRARKMLEDGANYHEVARTLGRCPETIERRFPGYTWTKYQAAQAAVMGRIMRRIERHTGALEPIRTRSWGWSIRPRGSKQKEMTA